MTGVTEADAAAAGASPAPVQATDEAEQRGARFRNPAVQDAIRNPEQLVLESEVEVSDWLCPKCAFVTTTYGFRPLRCEQCGARGAQLDGPDERIQDEEFRMTLAFSSHDIRQRKVYERIEHLRSTLVSEMTYDNPGARLERDWLSQHPGTERVGMTSPRTIAVARELLQFIADCPKQLVDGISVDQMGVGIRALLGLYIAHIQEAAQKKTERTASVSAPSTRS